MNHLTQDEVRERKGSDTLVVLGCGYSINDITPQQWRIILRDYDSIGMNWFCNSGREVTWYLVREQCVTPKRLEPGSMHEDFVRKMSVFRSTKIVKDMGYRENNYQWAQNTHHLTGSGYVFHEIPGKCGAKAFRHDIFSEGIHHGKSSLVDTMHFAVQMGYKHLIFCGVDLYDSRYFWLGEEETREIVRREGSTWSNPHPTQANTLRLLADFKAVYPEVLMEVQNPKSVLTKLMGVWE